MKKNKTTISFSAIFSIALISSLGVSLSTVWACDEMKESTNERESTLGLAVPAYSTLQKQLSDPSSAEVSSKSPEEPAETEVKHRPSVCMTYERVVSLGSFCQTRHQIHRHLTELSRAIYVPALPFDKDLVHDMWGGSQLFDWTIICDYPTFIQCIENKLERLFERKELSIVHSNVRNTKYRVVFDHLFARELGRGGSIDPRYETLIPKFNYLKKKFFDLSQYTTLYVLTIGRAGFDCGLNSQNYSSVLKNLQESLREFRGNSSFSLLVCDLGNTFNCEKKDAELLPRIFYSKVAPHPKNDWAGDRESWKRVLSQYQFSPKDG